MMDNLSAEVIDELLKDYPKKWMNDVPKLDKLGAIIRSRNPICLSLIELIQISDWKAGERNRGRLPKLKSIVRHKTMKAFAEENDSERMRCLVSPWSSGSGIDGVGVPLGSAVLRFIFPDKFGCVDWRNWYVLSQCQNEDGKDNVLIEEPLLPALENPYSSVEIGINFYCNYLQIIREIAKRHPQRTELGATLPLTSGLLRGFPERTPAEIDMALFSYSWAFIGKRWTK